MGIPHLSTYLQPYSTTVVLGRNDNHHTDSTAPDNPISRLDVVIDGPGLAYYIYHRLLSSKTHANYPLDTRPSYDELGQGVLAFLDRLQAQGLQVSSIYFDGYLPLRKRDIRIQRLESDLKTLVTFQKRHPNGFPVSVPTHDPLFDGSSNLFSPRFPLSSSLRRAPTSPFLVSAVLDALARSKYASITAMVPGEADAYCAKMIREAKREAVVLTGDSDLLVYDLGPNGGIIFFNTLEIDEADPISRLKASVHHPAEIAKRLNLPDLKRLAYEIRLDPAIGFAEAKKRASLSVKDVMSWQRFVEEYSDPDASAGEPRPLKIGQFLDPRVSELVLQLNAAENTPNDEEISIYLPFLIEDPARASAWSVSSRIRHLAYLLLVSSFHGSRHLLPTALSKGEEDTTTINEVSRRGNRILSSSLSFNLCTMHSQIQQSLQHLSRLRATKPHFATLPPWLRYRIFALEEIHVWYLDTDKTPPSPALILEVLTGKCRNGVLSWDTIHLTAQMEALLYALRILKQVAFSTEYMDRDVLVEGKVREVAAHVHDLPDISALMLGRRKIQELWATIVTDDDDVGLEERIVQWIFRDDL
ncbi:MAG: hypothetical protein Q9222_004553 [Ikaeria aurantiellina]